MSAIDFLWELKKTQTGKYAQEWLNEAIQALKQMDALNKIRAEIEKERDAWDKWEEADYYYSYDNCLEIIDKYRKEQTDV